MMCKSTSVIVVFALSLVVSGVAGVARSDDKNKRRDITFDDIKFEMKKGTRFNRKMLTKKVVELDKKPVKIRGYILPGFQQKGITQFVLVRDNMECCFGPGAALFDAIIVRMAPGKTTSFSVRPVAVEGTFSVQEVRSRGKHLAIYAMTAEEVK
jgi:hypothetical protein